MAKKNKLIWLSAICLSALLIGCLSFIYIDSTKRKGVEKEEEIPSAELLPPQIIRKKISVSNDGDEKKDIDISRKKINIYIIDEKGNNTLPLVSFLDSANYSPKTVAEAVILALGERSFETQIGEIKEEEDKIKVDLLAKDPKFPFGKVSALEEELVLDCISYSILDNFTKFKNIFFTVNGEAYKSNNIQLQVDKPFISQ